MGEDPLGRGPAVGAHYVRNGLPLVATGEQARKGPRLYMSRNRLWLARYAEQPESVMDVTKMRIYREARSVATEIIEAIEKLDRNPSFRLTDQIRASSTSITHCLLEGMGRTTTGEKLQMLSHASGSLWETIDALHDMRVLGIITELQQSDLEKRLRSVSIQLALMAASLLDKDPTYRGAYRPLAERGRRFRQRARR